MKLLKKILASTFIGMLLGLTLTYTVPQASAAVGAIFDTINRGYFVTTGAYNMTIGTTGTGTFNLVAAGTPVAEIDSNGIEFQSGFGPKLVPNSGPVFISTPVTGTNYVPPGFSLVAATATANTAAFVGAATPVAGTTFKVYNASASTVYLKAAGGATINGAEAAGRFVLATKCVVDCVYASTTNLVCTPPVCATPLAA